MPIRPQKWHAAIAPNTGTGTDGSYVLPNAPIFAVTTGLTNGNFVSIWAELSTTDTTIIATLKGQLFNTLGVRIGSEFTVNSSPIFKSMTTFALDAGFMDVSALPGGEFVVTWSRTFSEGNVVFQRFGSLGGKLGLESKVDGASSVVAPEIDPSVTTLANGDYVVSWTEKPSIDGSPNPIGIHASIYSRSGIVKYADVNLTNPASQASEAELAALPNGDFVVAYRQSDDIRFGHFGMASIGGTPFWYELQGGVASNQPTGVQDQPTVAGLSNSGWAVAWRDNISAFEDTDVYLRVYDSTGASVKTVTVANSTAIEGSPSVTAGKDGTFLLTWDSWNQASTTVTGHVFAQLFTNAGMAIGTPIQVDNNIAGTVSGLPIVSVLSDGRYLVNWSRSANALPGHNYVQILDGRDATINGTNTNDVIAGHDTGQSFVNDTINALGGNDRVFGMGGNDIFRGGAGLDVLSGGLGNDWFVFNTVLSAATNRDTITDFRNVAGNNDTIILNNAIFTKIAADGPLNPALFKANAAGVATDVNDRIVYNTTTGVVLYDSNGNAAGGATAFAVLSGHPTISALDFLVV